MIRIINAVCICLMVFSCNNPGNTGLTIAVASNMRYAMKDLVEKFEQNSGIQTQIVVSSSGKLTAQILEGAPYDVLLSADLKYPEKLDHAGLTVSPPKVYAYGKLVLWSQSENVPPSIEILRTPVVSHIALPNPKTAPYGVAASEVLEQYELIELLGPKLVFGESISQTNQFVVSGTAEIGFTAKSVVLSPAMKDYGQWFELDPSLYTPLAQGIVIMKNDNTAFSQRFFDFLFSPEGQMILQQYGYEASDEL